MSTPHISEDALGHIWWHLTRRSWNGRRSFVTHTRTWRQIFLGCFRAPRCYQGPWLLLSCPASAAPYSSSQRKGSWTGRPRLSRLSLCLGEVTPRSPRWWGGAACIWLARTVSCDRQRHKGSWENGNRRSSNEELRVGAVEETLNSVTFVTLRLLWADSPPSPFIMVKSYLPV